MTTVWVPALMFLLVAGVQAATNVAHDAECTPATDTCVTTDYCDPIPSTKKCLAKKGSSCTDTADCATGSECTGAVGSKTCTCIAGYSAGNPDYVCAIPEDTFDGACKSDNTCTLTKNLKCESNTKCICIEGDYTGTTGKACYENNKIGGSCTAESCDVANTQCTNDKCTCEATYTSNDAETACVLNNKIGGACTVDNDQSTCDATNSICKEGKCKCNEGYTGNEGDAKCTESASGGLVFSVTTLLLAVIAGPMTWA